MWVLIGVHFPNTEMIDCGDAKKEYSANGERGEICFKVRVMKGYGIRTCRIYLLRVIDGWRIGFSQAIRDNSMMRDIPNPWTERKEMIWVSDQCLSKWRWRICESPLSGEFGVGE